MQKLTAREKIGIWCLLFLARWMMGTCNDPEFNKVMEKINHEVFCNL